GRSSLTSVLRLAPSSSVQYHFAQFPSRSSGRRERDFHQELIVKGVTLYGNQALARLRTPTGKTARTRAVPPYRRGATRNLSSHRLCRQIGGRFRALFASAFWQPARTARSRARRVLQRPRTGNRKVCTAASGS